MEPLTSLGRRDVLKAFGIAGVSWLTPVGHLLAAEAERSRGPARSIILVWLAGGPSQLETFDPKPGTPIASGSRARQTALKGVQLAHGFEQLADLMGEVALVRSIVSKEGDHERGTYLMKTGYRPDATVEHPSIGAICCHELPVGDTGIPRHVSILPSQWPARGGFLGGAYDAFQVNDPAGRLPDVTPSVDAARNDRRLADLDVVERRVRPRPFPSRRRDAPRGHHPPRPRDDDLRTAQGVRRDRRAGLRPRRVRRHPVRPRLPRRAVG